MKKRKATGLLFEMVKSAGERANMVKDLSWRLFYRSGSDDFIFILRLLLEKLLTKKNNLYFAFVDLKKAFNWVPRNAVRWDASKARFVQLKYS